MALDGIDEALLVMLTGGWSDLPRAEVTGTVNVATYQRGCHVAMTADGVTVTDGAGAADAVVAAEPAPLMLWIWGRAPDSAVEVTGDGRSLSRLGKRLALAQ